MYSLLFALLGNLLWTPMSQQGSPLQQQNQLTPQAIETVVAFGYVGQKADMCAPYLGLTDEMRNALVEEGAGRIAKTRLDQHTLATLYDTGALQAMNQFEVDERYVPHLCEQARKEIMAYME